MSRLSSDSDLSQKSKKIFELIRSDTNILDDYTQADIDAMLGVLKLLTFNQGDHICQEGQPIDMFIIVLFGELRIGKNKDLTPK